MSSSSLSTSAPLTLPQKKGAFQPFKATSLNSSRKSDGLALLIVAAEAATAAGEFAPFPYIKGACGIFVTLLKAVENVRRNREDLKDLCEKIKEIVDILQAQVSASGATIAVRLKDVCWEFERFLQEMLVAVARIRAETEGFRGQIKGFIKSSSISAEIAGYEKRIQELISNIHLITGFDTNSRAIKIESTLHAMHAMISPDPSAVQVPQHANNCPPASRIFQGRDKILAKMQEYFVQDVVKQHIYVLHGLGGAGKTQIALKFIQESSHFTNIFFVDASTVDTIETGLRNIAKLQSISDSSNDAVKWLVTRHEAWLVFFDNADDPKLDLNKFLPHCNHGNIIITSRNPELRVYGSDSPVSGMEEEDAIVLLLKSSAVKQITSSDEERAADIVKVLWYLPLAIVQAGAFIAKFGALNHYLDLYAQKHNKLLREKPSQTHSDYEQTVYTTWQMSFDQLSPAAAMLLQLCSFLHHEGISEDIFSRAADYDFPSLGPSEEELQHPLKFLSQFQGPDGKWDTLAFLELTTEIMSYSLATFAPEKRTFSIHPLVQQWSWDILTDPEVKYCTIYSIIGMSIRGIPKLDAQLASLKLVPHGDAVMQFRGFARPDFRSAYAVLYLRAGRYQEAKALGISALEKEILLKGDDHRDTLYLMQVLATAYMKLGQLQKAEELQVAVLEKQRAIVGEDHLDTLIAMSNLRITYDKLGQFQKAKKLGLVVVEKQRGILGEDHPETLDAMYILAITYRKLGQLQKAKELGLVVVEQRGTILGEVHLETLNAMCSLAVTYMELHQFEEAKELELVVLDERRAILGEDHPETLDAMYILATTYRELGQLPMAEEFGLVVVEKRRAILGADHPDTVSAMQNLAITYGELGQFQHAEELQLVVLERRSTTLGADHLDTLSAMQNLAITYGKLDQFQKAKDLGLMMVEKGRGILGGNNLETLNAMCSLAITYMQLGQFEKTEELELAVLDERRAILGENHPETLNAMYSLVFTYRKLGQLQKAKELGLVVMAKRSTILGADHLDTLNAKHNLAVTYLELSQFEDALMLQTEVSEKLRTILGEDHLHTLNAMHDLEIIYRELGKFQKAKDLGLVVVEKRSTILGVDHLHTLLAMHNLAITYEELGQSQKAEELEVVVVEKRRAILGEDHPETLNTMHNLAFTYRKLGQLQTAKELGLVVAEKRSIILGVDHLDTLNAMHNLAVIYLELSQFEDAQMLQTEVMEKFRTILGNDHPHTIRSISNLALLYRVLGMVAAAEDLEVLLLDDKEGTPASEESTSVSEASISLD